MVFRRTTCVGIINVLVPIIVVSAPAYAIKSYKHIILAIQENRTPDNLFQGLCNPPMEQRVPAALLPIVRNMTYPPRIG
jgi:hypothetical protein